MTTIAMTERYTVINKHLCYYQRSIVPNPFEATKAFLMAHAEGKLGKHLPYSVSVVLWPSGEPEKYPDAYNLNQWYMALSSDNPPATVDFARNPKLFRELVEPLDFSKPYDGKVADAIRAQFTAKAETKAPDIDAVDIEEARND